MILLSHFKGFKLVDHTVQDC